MASYHLTTPFATADAERLRSGDVVFLTGRV